MDALEEAATKEQLRVYDEEVQRGLLHSRSYIIKMEQYRLVLGERYPHD